MQIRSQRGLPDYNIIKWIAGGLILKTSCQFDHNFCLYENQATIHFS